eukprot:5904556-Prymnesium_polylepis.1
MERRALTKLPQCWGGTLSGGPRDGGSAAKKSRAGGARWTARLQSAGGAKGPMYELFHRAQTGRGVPYLGLARAG